MLAAALCLLMHVFFLVFSYHVLAFLPLSLVDMDSSSMQSVLYLPYRTLLELSPELKIRQPIVTYIYMCYCVTGAQFYIYTEIIVLYIEPNSKIRLAFAIVLTPETYLLIYVTLKPYIPTH